MDGHENMSIRCSRIPYPRTTMASSLQELGDSRHNSRPPSTMARAAASTGLKRPGEDISKSLTETKRQTLAERAGEYDTRGVVPATNSPGATGTIRAASITALASKNQNSIGIPKPTSYTGASNRTMSSLAPCGGHLARGVDGGAGRIPPKHLPGRHHPISHHRRPATAMGKYNAEDSETRKLSHSMHHNVLDVDERLRDVESQFSSLKDVMNESLVERKSLEKMVELSKSRAEDLQRQRDQLEEKHTVYQNQIDSLRQELQSAMIALETLRHEQSYKLDDQVREHSRELQDMRKAWQDDIQRREKEHDEALGAMERQLNFDLAKERSRSHDEAQALRTSLQAEQLEFQRKMQDKESELQKLHAAMEDLRSSIDTERSLRVALQEKLVNCSSEKAELSEKISVVQAQVDFLKSGSKQQSDQFSAMETRMQQALAAAHDSRQKLMKEETERRILFNKYQELKGNIRVMCRVRPVLEPAEEADAKILFPDATTSSSQIDVTGLEEKNSLGAVSRRTTSFEFDRVFQPGARNEEVFGEISQLVQSALDGYNVCIFCYGQTGSGKTYTMSSADGMISRATHMIYDTAKLLEEKQWSYTMEGSFVEVYNEELHDLLSSSGCGGTKDPRKRLEIRHDEIRKTTVVLNCKSVQLGSTEEVNSMLHLAQSNRSVAATKANERSSRSHSIFILKLAGENKVTGERCQGTLNLVDLAGSERLKQSGAEGDRKRETQNINKSLACLGDVIEALGRGAPHIPYRNSKLTHLLQYSLGGNSKTLMFVMVSPLEQHIKETLTSLRFATKVYNTHIGPARPTKRQKERANDS